MNDEKLEDRKTSLRWLLLGIGSGLATIGLIAAGLVVLLVASAQAASPRMEPLEPGIAKVRVEPADGGADGLVTAEIVILAKPAAVWHVLVDCANAPNVMPNLAACSVIETSADGRTDIREHKIRWISVLPDLKSRFVSDYDPMRSIRFSKSGGDLSALDGEWRLEPIAGGAATRLHYRARVGFAALVPAFVIRGALERDIPGFLAAIGKAASSARTEANAAEN